MATKETRLIRGRRRGATLNARILRELLDARVLLGISQRTLAQELGCSQANLWRMEANKSEVTITRLSEMASLLGLELSMGLHELGDPLRDKGQQVVGKRFEGLLSTNWFVTSEALLPMPGDLRSWDKLLRLRPTKDAAAARHLVGVDLESRIRDIQALVRRTRLRERDGGVDRILMVCSDSATNRRLVAQLREALGPEYATTPRAILRALRDGTELPGSGVILV